MHRSIHSGQPPPLNFILVFVFCALLGVVTHLLFLPIHPSAAEVFVALDTEADVVAATRKDFTNKHDIEGDTGEDMGDDVNTYGVVVSRVAAVHGMKEKKDEENEDVVRWNPLQHEEHNEERTQEVSGWDTQEVSGWDLDTDKDTPVHV